MSENVWHPISTALKDGTAVILTWVDNGKPQEIYPGMVWNRFASNPFFHVGKGIWAYHSPTGELVMTWSDQGDGGPTHWTHWDGKPKQDWNALFALPILEDTSS